MMENHHHAEREFEFELEQDQDNDIRTEDLPPAPDSTPPRSPTALQRSTSTSLVEGKGNNNHNAAGKINDIIDQVSPPSPPPPPFSNTEDDLLLPPPPPPASSASYSSSAASEADRKLEEEKTKEAVKKKMRGISPMVSLSQRQIAKQGGGTVLSAAVTSSSLSSSMNNYATSTANNNNGSNSLNKYVEPKEYNNSGDNSSGISSHSGNGRLMPKNILKRLGVSSRKFSSTVTGNNSHDNNPLSPSHNNDNKNNDGESVLLSFNSSSNLLSTAEGLETNEIIQMASVPSASLNQTIVDFVQRFVPDMVIERISSGGAIKGEELSKQYAVAGFFDVAGFSSLARGLEEANKANSERVRRKKSNKQNQFDSHTGRGAEQLVEQLNETLSALIRTIRLAGGDIIKFAGDAILVVWMCEESELAINCLRATRCALDCCAIKHANSSLGLHVGIGCGELIALHVGGTFGRYEFFIAGESCTQCSLAEGDAGIDEVVISNSTLEKINSLGEDCKMTLVEMLPGGRGAPAPKAPATINNNTTDTNTPPIDSHNDEHHGTPSKPNFLVKDLQVFGELRLRLHKFPRKTKERLQDPAAVKAAEGYIPGPVRDALKSGGARSVDGLRKLSVIFFKLYDVSLPTVFDDATSKAFLAQAQHQAKMVQEAAYHYYGTLRQFILDDKGFVAIVALGLPPFFHEDNASRAVKVATRLIKINKVRAAAGVCSGTVFCGVIGSSLRAEYSVVGSCVNLAARFMSKAGPNNVLCDTLTKTEAESAGMGFVQMPALTVKGFDKPVDCFQPILQTDGRSRGMVGDAAAKRKTLSKKFQSHVAGNQDIVGRKWERNIISRAAFLEESVSLPDAKAVIIEGEAGMGKSHLAEWAVVSSLAEQVFVATSDSSEQGTNFFSWRHIIHDILLIESPAQKKREFPSTSISTTVSNGSSGGGRQRAGTFSASSPGSHFSSTPETKRRPSFQEKQESALVALDDNKARVSVGNENEDQSLLRSTNGVLSSSSDEKDYNHTTTSVLKKSSPKIAQNRKRVITSSPLAQGKKLIDDDRQSLLRGLKSYDSDMNTEGGEGLDTSMATTLSDDPDEGLTRVEEERVPTGGRGSMGSDASLGSLNLGSALASSSLSAAAMSSTSSKSNVKKRGSLESEVSAYMNAQNRNRGDSSSLVGGDNTISPNVSGDLFGEGQVTYNTEKEGKSNRSNESSTNADKSATRTTSSWNPIVRKRNSATETKPMLGGGGMGALTPNINSSGSSTTEKNISTTSSTSSISPAVPLQQRKKSVVSRVITSAVASLHALSPASPSSFYSSDHSKPFEQLNLDSKTAGGGRSRANSTTGQTPLVPMATTSASTTALMPTPSTLSLNSTGRRRSATGKTLGLTDLIHLPENSLVLSSLRASGKLTPRRVAAISILLPYVVVPPAVSSSTSSAITATTASATSEPISDKDAAIDIALLILNECSLLFTTLIIFEDAQNLDLASWELLYRAINYDGSKSSSSFSRLRFVITMRPFFAPKDSAYHLLKTQWEQVTPSRAAFISSTNTATNPDIPVDKVNNNNHNHDNNSNQSLGKSSKLVVLQFFLGPLTRQESGLFLSHAHHVVVGEQVLDFLYTRARGNPRALLDGFKALQDRGVIEVEQESGNLRVLSDLDEIGDMIFVMPVDLRAKILQKFDKLSSPNQLLLKLASACGKLVNFTLLVSLFKRFMHQAGSEGSFSKLSTAEVSDLTKKGLDVFLENEFMRPLPKAMMSGPTSSVWVFQSDHIRFLVYNLMLYQDRFNIHSAILKFYDEHQDIREEPGMMGYHATSCEEFDRAFSFFELGIRESLATTSITQAVDFWDQCNDLLENPEVNGKPGFASTAELSLKRIRITFLLSHVYIKAKNWDEAANQLRQVLNLSNETLQSGTCCGLDCFWGSSVLGPVPFWERDDMILIRISRTVHDSIGNCIRPLRGLEPLTHEERYAKREITSLGKRAAALLRSVEKLLRKHQKYITNTEQLSKKLYI